MTDNFETRSDRTATSFNAFAEKMTQDAQKHNDSIYANCTHNQQTHSSGNICSQQHLENKSDSMMVHKDQLLLHNTQNMLDSDFYNPKICEGCDTVITDLYIMKVKSKAGQQTKEQCWHERCLKCCMCRQTMTEKCYERDGRFYCSEDYYSLFGGKCSICNDPIAKMELVMRATSTHYCHISCFRCVTCHRQLGAGDLYSVNAEFGWPYCQYHTMDAMSGPGYAPSHHHHMSNIGSGHVESHDMLTPMTGGNVSYWSDDCLDDDLHGNGKNDKRPRTVLSSSQRRVLKSAFDRDPKPSKKARHVMAVETGLTNRVVQVWFQNQRAKMKKRSKPSSTTADESDSEPSQKNIGGTNIDSISADPDHNDYVTAETKIQTTDEGVGKRGDDMLCSEDEEQMSDFQMTSPSDDPFHPHTNSKLLELNSPSLYPQYCF